MLAQTLSLGRMAPSCKETRSSKLLYYPGCLIPCARASQVIQIGSLPATRPDLFDGVTKSELCAVGTCLGLGARWLHREYWRRHSSCGSPKAPTHLFTLLQWAPIPVCNGSRAAHGCAAAATETEAIHAFILKPTEARCAERAGLL